MISSKNLVDGVDCARPLCISCHDCHDEGDTLLANSSRWVVTLRVAILPNFQELKATSPASEPTWPTLPRTSIGISTDDVWTLFMWLRRSFRGHEKRLAFMISMELGHCSNFLRSSFGLVQDLWCAQDS